MTACSAVPVLPLLKKKRLYLLRPYISAPLLLKKRFLLLWQHIRCVFTCLRHLAVMISFKFLSVSKREVYKSDSAIVLPGAGAASTSRISHW